MKNHYHVLRGMEGLYTPDINYIATTKREAWNIASWELKVDREAGRKVTQIGKQEWHVTEYRPSATGKHNLYPAVGYTCEITTCYESDCLLDV